MDNPTLTIRISQDLKDAVTEAAAADNRSMTSYVVTALYAALEMGPAYASEMASLGKSKVGKKSKQTQ